MSPVLARGPRVRLGLECLECRTVPAVHTFLGGNAGNVWSNPANWDAAGVPTTGEPGGTTVRLAVSNTFTTQDIAGLVVDRIEFTGEGLTVTLNAPLGLNGATFATQIVNSGGNFNTIQGAALNLTGGTAVVQADRLLRIASPITGAQGLRKTGPGFLSLESPVASTYSGGTVISDGTLSVNVNVTNLALGQSPNVTVGDGTGAPGSAVLDVFGGGSAFADTVSVTVNADGGLNIASAVERITTLNLDGGRVGIGGGSTLVIVSGGSINATGAPGEITGGMFSLGEGGTGSVTFNVADGPGASDLTINPQIFGRGSYTKTGAGTLTVTGTDTIPDNALGTATVAAGVLEVTGGLTRTVTVGGGTLTGGGSIVTVNGTAGQIAPGGGVAPATLLVGSVALSGVTYRPVVAGAAADRIAAFGTVNLTGAALSVVPVSAPLAASYVLIDNDGADAVTGTFAGLPQGAAVVVGGQSYILSYAGGTGNDVTLTLPGQAPPVSGTPASPASPAVVPPAPVPFFSGATTAGNVLTVTGSGVPGGAVTLVLPDGSFGLFTDVNGDGKGDVVLIIAGNIFVFNGATGGIFLTFTDTNGDGVRELMMF